MAVAQRLKKPGVAVFQVSSRPLGADIGTAIDYGKSPIFADAFIRSIPAGGKGASSISEYTSLVVYLVRYFGLCGGATSIIGIFGAMHILTAYSGSYAVLHLRLPVVDPIPKHYEHNVSRTFEELEEIQRNVTEKRDREVYSRLIPVLYPARMDKQDKDKILDHARLLVEPAVVDYVNMFLGVAPRVEEDQPLLQVAVPLLVQAETQDELMSSFAGLSLLRPEFFGVERFVKLNYPKDYLGVVGVLALPDSVSGEEAEHLERELQQNITHELGKELGVRDILGLSLHVYRRRVSKDTMPYKLAALVGSFGLEEVRIAGSEKRVIRVARRRQ
jgi:hypothetical protein